MNRNAAKIKIIAYSLSTLITITTAGCNLTRKSEDFEKKQDITFSQIEPEVVIDVSVKEEEYTEEIDDPENKSEEIIEEKEKFIKEPKEEVIEEKPEVIEDIKEPKEEVIEEKPEVVEDIKEPKEEVIEEKPEVVDNNQQIINALRSEYYNDLIQYDYLRYFVAEKIERYVDYKLEHPDKSFIDVITHVNIGLDKSFYTNIKIIDNPHCLTALVNKYNAVTEDFVPQNLQAISSQYASGTQLLIQFAKEAYENMAYAASKEGIKLTALSTYRSYDSQYKNYWSKVTVSRPQWHVDLFNARPGHSEHTLGLAVDINSFDQSFENTKAFKWLIENAHKYGFVLRYPKGKSHITGYNYEPWHYRFLGEELAKLVNESGLTYDEYYVRYIKEYEKVKEVTEEKQLVLNK